MKKAINEPGAVQSLLEILGRYRQFQQLYLTHPGWTLIGPNYAGGLNTGVIVKIVGIQDNITYSALQVEIDAKPVAIIMIHLRLKRTNKWLWTTLSGVNLSTADITGDGAQILWSRGTSRKFSSSGCKSSSKFFTW